MVVLRQALPPVSPAGQAVPLLHPHASKRRNRPFLPTSEMLDRVAGQDARTPRRAHPSSSASRRGFLLLAGLVVSITPLIAQAAPPKEDKEVSWGAFGPAVFPQPDRLVAVGDLHGDLEAARKVLRVAGVLHPSRDEWVGGKTVLVQVGDQLDRGDDELAIIALLHNLSMQAERAGGALHVMLGNHETMTAMDQMVYGTRGAFERFDLWEQECKPQFEGKGPVPNHDEHHCELYTGNLECGPDDATCQSNLGTRVPDWARARYLAVRKGGAVSRTVFRNERRSFLVVGDTLFVHGGALPEHVKDGARGLEQMNREVARWIAGEGAEPGWLNGENSPFWTRYYSQGVIGPKGQCKTLNAVFGKLPGVKRMVVGHTPQQMGCNEVCNGGVWRIDTGMSEGVMGGAKQALEILKGGQVTILREGARGVSGSSQGAPRGVAQGERLRGGGVGGVGLVRRVRGWWGSLVRNVMRLFAGKGWRVQDDAEGDAITKQQCTKDDH